VLTYTGLDEEALVVMVVELDAQALDGQPAEA
jgi:hypothetical protein